MNGEERIEYAEACGLHLLADIAPLTAEEYALLHATVERIEAARLVDQGVSRKDAAEMLRLVADWFAFEAVAK